jgi:TRAP-type C4-dicarboxylate transport system substrate-binding protein
MKPLHALAVAVTAFSCAAAFAQTKWDMPTPYAATNFHTENVVRYAADVEKATGVKRKITVNSISSLVKAPES